MAKQKAPAGVIDQIWKFFASVKLSVFVLLFLAATSIIGTLIPQNADPAMYFHKYGEFAYRIFSAFNIFDMYHSWWFRLLLLMLSLNIIVCSMDRLSSTWKIVFKRDRSYNLNRFQKRSNRQTFFSTQHKTALADRLRAYFTRKAGTFHEEITQDGTVAFFYEKGRWTRLGVYAVHLSILLLLAGGMAGSFWGFEGYLQLSEGGTSSTVSVRNSKEKIELPFEIRCDDFFVSFYESGAPDVFRSTLSILKDGKAVETKDILVNDPMRFDGINIFQASYGKDKPKEITLSIAARESSMVYQEVVRMGNAVDLPEGLGKIEVIHYMNNFNFKGHKLGETFICMVTEGDKDPYELVVPVRFPTFDKMRKGAFAVSVTDFTSSYYTGLQINKDPGVWVVYAGFLIMILGCYVSFFMSHQIFCVEVKENHDQCEVSVSGTANRNKLGMENKIKNLSEKLSGV